jgi:hypothetical protein
MAEQRPYRLSGTAADTRLSQIKIVVLLSLGSVFVVVNWMTTQHAARLFGYSPALGQPWCDFPPVGSLYRPWNWMVWWLRWHSTRDSRRSGICACVRRSTRWLR